MGFSGLRAVIMVLVVLVLAITKFDLPGWLLPVGLMLAGGILKESAKRTSASTWGS